MSVTEVVVTNSR